MHSCFSTTFDNFILYAEVVPFFESLLQGDPEMSTAIAAIQTLMEFMKRNSGNHL